jgi:hypothetical protein
MPVCQGLGQGKIQKGIVCPGVVQAIVALGKSSEPFEQLSHGPSVGPFQTDRFVQGRQGLIGHQQDRFDDPRKGFGPFYG